MKATQSRGAIRALCVFSLLFAFFFHPSESNPSSFDSSARQIIRYRTNPRNNLTIQVSSYGRTGMLRPEGEGSYFKGGTNPETESPREDPSENSIQNVMDNPPPWEETAKMARYIVKYSNWSSLATISSRQPTTGFPFVNIVSVSDGPTDKSTGIPYLYVTGLDMSVKDLQKDPRASLTMSLAQGDYCATHFLDPEDPRCAHVILTGNVVRIANGTAEARFAQQAMFTKHPVMQTWPDDHGFFFAKLDIKYICVLDYFGGAKDVDLKEYYKARVYS